MKTALLTSILLLSIATVSCNRASSRDPDRVAADSQRPESAPVAAPVAAADSGNPGKRALLVGINKYKYPDKVSPLAGPVNDVEAIRQILTGKFDFSAANVITLRNEQATHAAIVSAIQNELIAKAQKDDIVVFYFSGHGSQMK